MTEFIRNLLQRVVAGAGLLLLPGSAPGAESTAPVLDESLYPQGRYVYQRNCLVCHGARGDGKGEMAKGMFPRPRPFTAGIFKYRSTPPGFLPTTDDLMRIVRGGLGGTSMPAFAILSEREIRSVVEYIKFYSPKWRKSENHTAPVTIPSMPSWFGTSEAARARASGGRELYLASCAACHGESGAGDGPAALTLLDDWDEPSPPASLLQPTLRGGQARTDLYRTLLTGIGGTPMPSFGETLSDEQRWEIVAFIKSLRKETSDDP